MGSSEGGWGKSINGELGVNKPKACVRTVKVGRGTVVIGYPTAIGDRASHVTAEVLFSELEDRLSRFEVDRA
jgi:hypothetical protein